MLSKGFMHFCRYAFHKRVFHRVLSSLLFVIFIAFLVLPTVQAPVHAASAPTPQFPPNLSTLTATGESGTIAAPPQAMPVFSWGGSVDAKTYKIQFSQDVGFSANVTEVLTPLTQYTPVSVSVFNDGDWYWRVRVENPTPVSPWSPIFRFTKRWASSENAPVLLSPDNGAGVTFNDLPVFSWEPVIGAAAYRFQISPSIDFPASPPVNELTLTTTYQHTAWLQNGTYYWRVIPVDPSNHEGTPSEKRLFVLGYNQVPVLIEPANTSRPTFTPVFRWTAVRGASEYQVQISTDPAFGAGTTTTNTKNTTLTLTNPLENDKNYYWRVRAYNGVSYSKWSNEDDLVPWYFVKRWYIQPVLLTPTASFPYVRFPFFSWTPVPGAAYYRIEVSATSDFISPNPNVLVNNTSYTPDLYSDSDKPGVRYWRVTPYDSAGKMGRPSSVGQYYSSIANNAPDLVSPLYYYPPNTFPSPDQAVAMNPYEDRSVAYPLFTWQHQFNITTGEIIGKAYRLQVGTTMNTNGTVGGVVWSVDTENLTAAPMENEFSPTPGVVYFWQVTPLDQIGGNRVGDFSQAWKVVFNPTKALPATSGQVPQPLRPNYSAVYQPAVNPGYDSAEFAETTPALEWFPVNGASYYEVQISRSADFSNPLETGTVTHPMYTSRYSYGQRNLGHLDYGSYYWRVRPNNGTWSEPWRYQVAAQSQWIGARTLGDIANRLEIAHDSAVGEVAADFDLNRFYASQDLNYWYMGFEYAGTGNGTYVIYLDTDNRNGSGANVDKFGYPVTFNTAHLPEFAIYITKNAGAFNTDNVVIYRWLGIGWDTGGTLSYLSGQLFTNGSYLELKLPYDPIGMQVETGTYSIALVSIDAGVKQVIDTVPQNAVNAGAAVIDHITTVTEHATSSMPPSDINGDPTTFPTIPPFFWNAPAGAWWSGYELKAYRDAAFTTEVATLTTRSNARYYNQASHAWADDFDGNNTYYWRVRPRYLVGSTPYLGSWSQAWRFERYGFIPQNLQVSVTQATPTFSWDRVEGADKYKLQVDNDPNFGSREVDLTTSEPSYTPLSTLQDGVYYWKVLVQRRGGEFSEWSPTQTFTLALPAPTGLTPDNPSGSQLVNSTPTFCWSILSVSNGQIPVLFPYKYRVQVSKGDPTFSPSSLMETTDTVQNCYTPKKGYDDLKYYWHVAMIDGAGRVGRYSQTAAFTKQYPIAKPKYPLTGNRITDTPIFTWTAADGQTPYVYRAATYYIQVCEDPNYSVGCDSATTTMTTFTPIKKYKMGVTYYWHVAILDKDNKRGPFTDAVILINTNKFFLPYMRR